MKFPQISWAFLALGVVCAIPLYRKLPVRLPAPPAPGWAGRMLQAGPDSRGKSGKSAGEKYFAMDPETRDAGLVKALAISPETGLQYIQDNYGRVPEPYVFTMLFKAGGLPLLKQMLDGGMNKQNLLQGLQESAVAVTPDEVKLFLRSRPDSGMINRILAFFKPGSPEFSDIAKHVVGMVDFASNPEGSREHFAAMARRSPEEKAALVAAASTPFEKGILEKTLGVEAVSYDGPISNYLNMAGAEERKKYLQSYLEKKDDPNGTGSEMMVSAASIQDREMRAVAVKEAFSLARNRGALGPLAAIASEPSLLADPEIISSALRIASQWDGAHPEDPGAVAIRKAAALNQELKAQLESDAALKRILTNQ